MSPIYIVSRGRWDNQLTAKALDDMDVPYQMIVCADEYKKYRNHFSSEELLELPQDYIDMYDTCDDLGTEKSVGPGAARNFAWDTAIESRASHHWVMDDNIDAFHRLNRNIKAESDTGVIFQAAEDFVNRYQNLAISGFNYYSFCKSTDAVPPYYLNTRVYSCLYIDNDIPYRWRGRYNEDTDLCLRVLKDGFCTLQFNAFLCGKVTTQRMKGGNTEEFYKHEGTLAKSQMLVDLHPDVAKLVWKFNRWHHQVDYRRFKDNELQLKPNIKIPQGINNYGMILT
jgi:hypothetical protein